MTLHSPVSSADHTQGDLNSPLIIVHYGDFECPFSAAAADLMLEVQEQLKDQLLYVFRPFPLADIHPNALRAAEAAETAATQGKFWPMYELLFTNQDQLSVPFLRACAERLGLDMERFDRELHEGTHREAIRKSVESGRASGAHGTPTFFINGKFFDNRLGLWEAETMFEAIEEALRKV
jgi:protein-disulfide isomerase